MNVLYMVQDTARTLGLPVPDHVGDPLDTTTERLCSCIGMAAEELAAQYNWIALRFAFTIRTGTTNPHWVEAMGGYNLDSISNGMFDRFGANYMYNTTTREVIHEVTTDHHAADATSSPIPYPATTFFRYNKCVCFYPDIPEGHDVVFYYQSRAVAVSSAFVYKLGFAADEDEPLLSAPLLKRGGIVHYNSLRGFESPQSLVDYNNYTKYCKDTQAPAGVQIPRGWRTWQ